MPGIRIFGQDGVPRDGHGTWYSVYEYLVYIGTGVIPALPPSLTKATRKKICATPSCSIGPAACHECLGVAETPPLRDLVVGGACPNPSGGQPLGCGMLLLAARRTERQEACCGSAAQGQAGGGEAGSLAGSRNKESGRRHGEMRAPFPPL